MTSKWAMRWALGVPCSVLLVHAVHRVREPITIDDAYMVMRYAKQLLAGHGHAWNPDGVQVFGVTGTLHLLVVTLLRALLSTRIGTWRRGGRCACGPSVPNAAGSPAEADQNWI